MMRQASQRTAPPSGRFFYAVAVLLGTAFSAALWGLAWNNSLQSEERTFAYEIVSLESSVRTQAHLAEQTLWTIARLAQLEDLSERSDFLSRVCALALAEQPFTRGIAWYARSKDAAGFSLSGSCVLDPTRSFPLKLGSTDAEEEDLSALAESSESLPWSLPGSLDSGAEYALARRVAEPAAGPDAVKGVVIALVDARKLLGERVLASSAGFDFVIETPGLFGRRVLVRKTETQLATFVSARRLSEVRRIPFAQYTLKLEAGKGLSLADVDRALLLTALLLGAGITLLLVALARAKELQMRDLSARNLVIEEQVRRQTWELAQARDAALDASRVKSDFLASMSHEIRTPLNAIIGMAELLADTSLSGEQKRYVDVFRNAGEALLSLVNDILDLSKIEAGQLTLEAIEFEPRELVEQAVDLYAIKAGEKALELAVNVDSEVPATLIGDPARLRQVLLNLVGNAVKFTSSGEILVSLAVRRRDADGALVHCTVRDTGIGIPPDKLEAVFGSFTQVDSSTTRRYGGTGLGLAICRRLLEMMQGRIWVESVLGEGSVFQFEVDLRRGAASGASVLVPTPNVAGKSVLVIDDNATNRLILAQTLGLAGARVLEAASGKNALRLVSAQPGGSGSRFDIVLCDSQMPELDGMATVTELISRGVAPGRVLMLTSARLEEEVARTRQLGLAGHLLKPVKRRDLYQALGRLLRETQPEQPAPAPSASAPMAPREVLLVEDNADNRLLVRAYLKNAPYRIEEAVNGAEAVILAQEREYDLILMDIQMPVMDGHSATRAIRAFEAEVGRRPAPIVALTAHAVKEEIDRSLVAGCTAHITKPIKKATLLEMLERQFSVQPEAGRMPAA